MPTCRRKRVTLIEPSPTLLDAANLSTQTNVYYLEQTGEIFTNYECVLISPIWSCTPRLTSHTLPTA
jgi:hypothetical protein